MRDSLIFPRTVRPLRMAAVLSLAAVVFSASAPTVLAQSILPREAALEVRKQFIADLDVLHGKFLALAAQNWCRNRIPGQRTKKVDPAR